MDFITTIKLVLRTLLARKGRSFLTMLGIVIGVAGVIIIISLGAGAQNLVLGQITRLGTNLIGVLPGKSDETGPPAAAFGIEVTTLTIDDAEAIRNSPRVPHASAVIATVRGNETIVWQNREMDIAYVGTQADYSNVFTVSMREGRFFDEREEKASAQVIVLG